MKLAIIGTGYVGLVTGTIFAELGHDVVCVDILPEKVEQLRRGESPIYEPGLAELIKRNLAEGRLTFTTDHAEAVAPAAVIFNAVDTPSAPDGSVDLTAIKAAARQVGEALNALPKNKRGFRVIVNKSTVPIGTANLVKDLIAQVYDGEFDVVSNPEFLREGQAVADCFNPDRIVIGDGHPQSHAVMAELYRPLAAPILFTDVATAEMIKYASNAFLATSISFINNLSWLCARVGADVTEVSEGMRLDKRIGRHAFLSAGPGYGGSCFPKDVKGIISIARDLGVDLKVLRMVEEVNDEHRGRLVPLLEEALGDLTGRTVAVWGLAFKPETDDLREAASLTVIPMLQERGAAVRAFDPVAQEKATQIFQNVAYFNNPYETVRHADALIILTEWKEFMAIDRHRVAALLRRPLILDSRNLYDPQEMRELGFTYLSIGRPSVTPEGMPAIASVQRQQQ